MDNFFLFALIFKIKCVAIYYRLTNYMSNNNCNYLTGFNI